MAYTETPKEKEKRLAYYAKNKADADDKEAKSNAEIKRKFNETTNTDTSKNTNPMGDTYKKGGKVMKKKIKRYEEGGDVEFETAQGQNKNIGDDVRARAMAAMDKGSADTPAVPKKTAEKLTPKAAPKEEPKPAEKKKESAPSFKESTSPFKDAVSSFKAKSAPAKEDSPVFKATSKPAKEDSSAFKAKTPSKESSSSFKDASSAFKNAKSSFKSGGSVRSSASKRADGCAIRGKTRA